MANLKAIDLVKTYGKRRVVDKVCLEVNTEEVIGLLGPNGAGKTTSFYMVTGMIRPDSGHVQIDGEDITRLPMFRRARLGIGYLSQEPSIFRRMTVEQNIMAILETLKLSRQERRERLEELLNELSIEHLRKSQAMTLSGGERRRVEITRALVTRPRFILLDEPFAGVDPIAVIDIQNIIRQLKKRKIGVLITDHNVRETLSITDRSYLLYEGKVLISGTSRELSESEQARQLYLGDKFKLE